MNNSKNIKWGEIYYCNLGGNGSVQSGIRPVLVIQNNIGNENSPTTVVATITSVLKKLHQPILNKQIEEVNGKKSSIISILHRQLLEVGRTNLYFRFTVDFDQAEAYRKSTDQYLRAKQWEDLTVEVFI